MGSAASASQVAEIVRGMRVNVLQRLSIAVIAFSSVGSGSVIDAGEAVAEPPQPGCVSQFWMYGGLFGRSVTRYICDGPFQPDGSWMRTRVFHDPAYMAPARTTCSGGTWSSTCTHYPAYPVEEFFIRDVYRVDPGTVLPDEPGHIG